MNDVYEDNPWHYTFGKTPMKLPSQGGRYPPASLLDLLHQIYLTHMLWKTFKDYEGHQSAMMEKMISETDIWGIVRKEMIGSSTLLLLTIVTLRSNYVGSRHEPIKKSRLSATAVPGRHWNARSPSSQWPTLFIADSRRYCRSSKFIPLW